MLIPGKESSLHSLGSHPRRRNGYSEKERIFSELQRETIHSCFVKRGQHVVNLIPSGERSFAGISQTMHPAESAARKLCFEAGSEEH
jgi:hypothetical protein